jgi:CheY-like chemotaxis protein
MLAVSDTGTGMSEAVQAHLFEPFFTTKAEGQGTGLGLATCFGIIKQNNGHIWYQTASGQGTRFVIYLPRDRANSAALEPQGKPPWISQGTETILLVEDDQPVRVIVARTLREQGYTLLEAGNAVEALALFQYEPLRIDLLVTDVVMPGLNGQALAEQALAARPGLKVLFISGYTDNVISQKSLGVETDYMQKPFSPGRLAEKVREILDRKA